MAVLDTGMGFVHLTPRSKWKLCPPMFSVQPPESCPWKQVYPSASESVSIQGSTCQALKGKMGKGKRNSGQMWRVPRKREQSLGVLCSSMILFPVLLFHQERWCSRV